MLVIFNKNASVTDGTFSDTGFGGSYSTLNYYLSFYSTLFIRVLKLAKWMYLSFKTNIQMVTSILIGAEAISCVTDGTMVCD